jgi:hypothetical protein
VRIWLLSAIQYRSYFPEHLPGDVFDDGKTARKVLSIRVAGKQKAKAIFEDERDLGKLHSGGEGEVLILLTESQVSWLVIQFESYSAVFVVATFP